MTEPRKHTLAFRLGDAEIRSVTELAAAAGLQPSEFARRAILDVVSLLQAALDEAREQGREDVRPRLRAVEQELHRALADAESQRQRAEDLATRLSKAPEELVGHVRRYVAGEPDVSYTIAVLWGRVSYSLRPLALPELVAAAADEVDHLLAQQRDGDEAAQLWEDLALRYMWLVEALSPNSGMPIKLNEEQWRTVWRPLDQKLRLVGRRRLKTAVVAAIEAVEDRLTPGAPTA